jgi:hypothetical protein
MAGAEILDDALACREAVESPIALRHRIVEGGILVENVDRRQRVALAHFVVVEVVRRRNLDAARAECRIHVLVGDDRDEAVRQRQPHVFADQMRVARIVGVHGDGRVAEHRLRPRRGDD